MRAPAVWAPAASSVELVVGESVTPMARSGGGWWSPGAADLGPSAAYAFSIDGGPPLPDPRSAWQPHGVDGPSRLVDHARYPWTDDGWRGVHLPSAVLYELHVGTFTPEGTFAAALGHLDHLVALGVDVVELMPVAEFGGDRGWGYDGVDLFAPHHAYGGPDGLKRFVDACHRRGIGVVMDVVYNHLGPAGNYLARFGPYFADRHVTNWGSAVNFDGPGSDGVRRFVLDNAAMWLRDYHCDGLRLDAVHAVKDDSALHLLEELSRSVAELAAHLGRPLFLIAESDLNDPRFVRPPELGGYGLDATWADEFHHALHAALTGETDGYYEDFGPLAMVATALHQGWVYAGRYSPHRDRVHGRPPEGVGGARFVVFLQNHDQVGNRATGDRIGAGLPPGRLEAGSALVLLSPFVPLLFQGEEWAAGTPFQYFTDHRDPELAEAVRAGRRREFAPFGWSPEDVPDPGDVATWRRSQLDWDELARPAHAEVLGWYRDLIALRRRRSSLTDGRRDRVVVTFDESAGWLVMHRSAVTVAVNLGRAPVDVEAAGTLLLASEPAVQAAGGTVHLPPDSVAVLAGVRDGGAGRPVDE